MVFGHFWTILPPLQGELFTKIWGLWLMKSYLDFSGRCDG